MVCGTPHSTYNILPAVFAGHGGLVNIVGATIALKLLLATLDIEKKRHERKLMTFFHLVGLIWGRVSIQRALQACGRQVCHMLALVVRTTRRDPFVGASGERRYCQHSAQGSPLILHVHHSLQVIYSGLQPISAEKQRKQKHSTEKR